jgi:Zn-dependent M28 family amino/carboxypeptidase
VNRNLQLQPDTALRRINAEEPTPGERQQVYCTKVGATRPDEMYIIGAHMDGHGTGTALNDDGSGTALVMELARIFSSPDVITDRTIRFALWNNEETGTNGARAYIAQRQALQGQENPPGSGKYPEPKWVLMVQHDMMMWDHGMPIPAVDAAGKPILDAQGRPTMTWQKEQRLEADVNVEFAGTSAYADQASKYAFYFRHNADRYNTNYPAAVGDRMSNTDSGPFQDLVPAISLRENERLTHTGNGWNPTWHQPIDVWSTFSDKDFMLGLNAAQTTLSAIANLSGAKLKR